MTFHGVDADTLTDVRLVLEAVNGLDIERIVTLPEHERLTCYAVLEDVRRTLGLVCTEVGKHAAEALSDKQVTVEGVGTFVKHGKRDRKTWDSDALLRDVLDTRLVDTHTGEVADESPLDKVLAVWNLGTPRVTALRARNLDPDQYCHSEWGGWSLEIVR